MLKKTVLLALILVAVTFMGSCTQATKLIGTLLLQPGQTGDVQNTRVELYEKADLTGSPVMFVASKTGTASQSDFEFTDVIEGYYYVLAWKDLSGDGVVSDGDIVGVHGGTYKPGEGGTQVTVTKDKTTDVGNIEMLIYKELKISASGERVNGGIATNLTYSFNYDVTITSLTITFPGLTPAVDPDAPGAKSAGTNYHSDGWNTGGGQMPTGAHTLEFIGTWEGNAYDVVVTVNIG